MLQYIGTDGFRRCAHMLSLLNILVHYVCKMQLILQFIATGLSGCIWE